MNKRFFAIVLCLTLLLSNLAPAAYATGEDPAAQTTSITTETDTLPSEQAVEPVAEEGVSQPEETTSEPASEPAEDVPVSGAEPVCSCGNEAKPVIEHADNCDRKAYYKAECDQTAGELYAAWKRYPADGQDFILTYLSWTNQTKLAELTALLNSDLSGEDSVTVDNTTVSVSGIPQGGSLTVAAPSEEAAAAVESFIAEQGKTEDTELFVWDISVQDLANADWQPSESVRVELVIPGVKLHKYDTVYVVHVDDNGNVSTIDAQVTENGGISFETNGFSTFAGFTVDFAFEGAEFSIPGETSIYLSEVFEQLKMPLYVEDVASVDFTNTELVTVTKDGDDWLLTSLAAFTSEEKLTVTMNSGDVYVIDVTDAITVQADFYMSYMDGRVYKRIDGYSVSGGNAQVQLFLDSDGHPSSNDQNVSHADFVQQPLVVDGRDKGGCMEIILQKADGAGNTLVWDLTQFRIINGAKVVIRLGASFKGTETITIRLNKPYTNYDARQLFDIEDGSLYFNLSAENAGLCPGTGMQVSSTSSAKEIIFDGGDLGASAYEPLIYMHRGIDEDGRQNLVVEGVTFRNAKHRALLVQTNNLNKLMLSNCTFESTVRDVSYGGGAIYIDKETDETSSGTAYKVDVHHFEMNNCTFNSSAVSYGGAVVSYGNLHKVLFSGCVFNGCETTSQSGGAIDLACNIGNITIQNSTFENCKSKYRGGAIDIRSASVLNSDGAQRWSRINSVTISGCTFTNCESTESHGGGIAVQAQLNSLTVSGCEFTNCKAKVNGGGISIDGYDLPDTFKDKSVTNYPDWAAELECDNSTPCTDMGSAKTGHKNWGTTASPNHKSWIGTVNINEGCTFTNCSATGTLSADGKSISGGNGGSIEFADGCYITESATISGATIDGSKSQGEGYAIFWSSCYVKQMNLTGSTIKNCTYTNINSLGPGGTVKVTGNSCLTLSVSGCQFLSNASHYHGGGLYWNAAKIIDGLTPEATVYDCTFDGNTAKEYGGGIYVESKISISKCNIKYNTAYMGGGIAQQVYNNKNARMLDEGGATDLTLDPQTWVHHNTANLGGGISIRANATDSIENGKPIEYTVRFEQNGAAVYQNTANKKADGTCGHGGGIYFIAES